jgi:hypothetical protein
MGTKNKTLAIAGSDHQVAACYIARNALDKHAIMVSAFIFF